jgi:hypothetical protein
LRPNRVRTTPARYSSASLASRLSSAYSPRALRSTGMTRKPCGPSRRHAQNALRPGFVFQPPDHAGFIRGAALFQPRQQPRTRPQRIAVFGRDHIDQRRCIVRVPVERPRQQFAVAIHAGDFQHRDFRQFALFGEAAFWLPAMTPSASSSFSRRLSRMRSEPLRPLRCARSRLVAPGLAASRASNRSLSSLGAFVFVLRANYSPATGSGFFLGAAFLAGTAFFLAAGFFSGFSGLAFAFGAGALPWALCASFSCRRPWRCARRSAPAPVPGSRPADRWLREWWHWCRRR